MMRIGSCVARAFRVVAVPVLLVCAPLGCSRAEPSAPAAQASPQSLLSIETAQGVREFQVEVVRTPQARARGLMYRKALAADAGMLFPFGTDAPRSFWMKNTILPLDIIFIHSSGEIVAIAEDTVPFSLKPIAPPEPAAAVLEVKAGTAARLGIRRGDKVRHPAIAP